MKNKKVIDVILKVLFVLYLDLLIYLLFFSEFYRRNRYEWNRLPLFSLENIKSSTNLIPFRNIYLYIEKLIASKINVGVFITNIIGNLVAFAPFGFFVPVLLKNKIKNTKNFIIFMIITVFIVEVLQFLTRVGTADIDDIILNTIGALIVYKITTSEYVKELLRKVNIE